MALITTIAIAVMALSAAAHAERFECQSRAGQSAHPVVQSAEHDHLRYAPAYHSGTVLEFAAFAASFDFGHDSNGDGIADLTGNPVWAAYHLRAVAPGPDGRYREPDVSIRRPAPWYRSPDLLSLYADNPDITASRIDDSYRGVGRTWNRGHYAMADHAQRISAQASCNTHVFWNASPQHASLNQGPWLHLETYTAAVSNYFGETWIVAGPIWDNAPLLNIASPGEIPVAVPHAFFKVVVVEIGGRLDYRALIYEHPSLGEHGDVQPDPDLAGSWVRCTTARSRGQAYDHTPHIVSLREVERRTGLYFFADHPRRRALVDAAPRDLWPIPDRYWSGFRCGPDPPAGPGG